MQLLFVACLAVTTGCARTHTTVERVWRDGARAEVSPGKTLVLALYPEPEVGIPLEQEWVRQLRARNIDAESFHALMPEQRPPDKETVVALVQTQGFETLLVSELVAVKDVERNISASQVAVVQTKLYDTATAQMYWSARSDTFLVSNTADRVHEPRSVQIRRFVEAIIKAMSRSHTL